MPVEVKGLVELRKAMRQFEPDLEKNLQKQVRAILKPVVAEARSFVDTNPKGLSNWMATKGKGKQITKSTSMFRRGSFPLFNPSAVKAGITYSIKPTRPNRNGFVSAFQLVNKTPAGAIYETAGTKHPGGQPWQGMAKNSQKQGSKFFGKAISGSRVSHSFNPNAGAHFIEALGGDGNLEGYKKKRGRLLYRAWEHNNGRALSFILRAVKDSEAEFNRRQSAVQVRKAA